MRRRGCRRVGGSWMRRGGGGRERRGVLLGRGLWKRRWGLWCCESCGGSCCTSPASPSCLYPPPSPMGAFSSLDRNSYSDLDMSVDSSSPWIQEGDRRKMLQLLYHFKGGLWGFERVFEPLKTRVKERSDDFIKRKREILLVGTHFLCNKYII